MRSVFIPTASFDDSPKTLEIKGKNAHHLITVARIKKGEDILILNGKGIRITAKVKEIGSKTLVLVLNDYEKCLPPSDIDLVAGVTKKDSFEKIIGLCVELGIGRLFPLGCEYSQRSFKNTPRISRLIESAMIQSNNPFFLRIMPHLPFKNLERVIKDYDGLFYFSSRKRSFKKSKHKDKSKILILVGPEGGLSSQEEKMLEDSSWTFVNLPTWILRSPTAVSAAVGHIIGLGH
ncbi:MAG: RsmE family RNA methyltransferase [Halobacteriovoraceae bacterium]|nr:RsmE family RNA methyltransferase [Halobacteriovoraceae bacterium]